MDCLSRRIGTERVACKFHGVKINIKIHIYHLMFVDDLLFGDMNIIEEWVVLHNIINTFSVASRLYMNKTKSMVISSDIEEARCREICLLSDIIVVTLDEGFTYLGFHLKPNNYNNKDWGSLIEKFKNKFIGWSNKWLIIGGRSTLVKSDLQNIFVFWMQLFMFPMDICHELDAIKTNFICPGSSLKGNLHLVRWKVIARPIDEGDWGILDAHSFNRALLINNLCRIVIEDNIWVHLIKEKYMQGRPFTL